MTKITIANGYYDTVYASVSDKNECKVRQEREVAGAVKLPHLEASGKKVEVDEYDNHTKTKGLTKIPSGEEVEFTIDPSIRVVKVTIFTADNRLVCQNHPVGPGKNLIVDLDATLKFGEKGFFSSSKWTDKSGKDHAKTLKKYIKNADAASLNSNNSAASEGYNEAVKRLRDDYL